MKIPNRLLVISALGLAFAGCTGSQGPAGDGGPAGTNALTKTSTEPPGSNCPSGGIKVQAGLDTNNDGVLDDNEVNAASTTYVCNGSGKNSLVATSAEPVGAN